MSLKHEACMFVRECLKDRCCPTESMAGGLQPPSEEEEKKQAAAKQQGVIFVLENASLEVARVGKVNSVFYCATSASVLVMDTDGQVMIQSSLLS